MTLTSRLPPLSTRAWTLSCKRLPTKTVPLSPWRIDRAFGTPAAYTSILKPFCGFSLPAVGGRLSAAVGIGGGAAGASFMALSVVGGPTAHDGGGVGAGAAPGAGGWWAGGGE